MAPVPRPPQPTKAIRTGPSAFRDEDSSAADKRDVPAIVDAAIAEVANPARRNPRRDSQLSVGWIADVFEVDFISAGF
jgi:hypothetical protein